MATIRDVAQYAKVSVGTVSNVLNGRGNVSAKRRTQVEDAIKTLAFSGSLLAKGMRSQRYPVVGLCVPNATSSNFVAMSDALEAHAAGARFELVQVITRHDPAREAARIDRLIASRASGVLILPTLHTGDLLKRLKSAAMPTVVINRFVEDAGGIDQVMVDHRSALKRATSDMISWGYDHLIFVTQYPGYGGAQQNIAGVRDAITDSGRNIPLHILKCGQAQAPYGDALAEVLKNRGSRTALITGSSLLAAWSIEALRELGLRVPKDIGVLCAEEPVWARATWPSLSCIQQPTAELAQIAWDLLARRMGGSQGPPVTIRCDARINFRESVINRS